MGKDILTTFEEQEYMSEDDIREEFFTRYGIRMDVPNRFLWGQQNPDRYSRGAEFRIKMAIHKKGFDFLEDNPALGVIVPDELHDRSRLIVIDGHHRGRFAPAFGYNRLPTLIMDVVTYAGWVDDNPYRVTNALNNNVDDATMLLATKKGVPLNGFKVPESLPIGLRALRLPEYLRQLEEPEGYASYLMRPAEQYVLHSRR